ncbi:MAG: hypothetical protein Q9186_001899 [Xanthomendoza sp. 1 TL-2023]
MTLFILALTGNVIAEAFSGNHSIINYTMFVAVFAMLSLLYLIGAAIIESFAIPLAMLVLDAINMLLFLIGGIALAAYLGVHSFLCLDQQNYQWFQEHVQKVSGGTSSMRVPMVWLCRMGCLSGPFLPCIAWRRNQRAPKG